MTNILTLEYVLQPVSMFLAYFAAEGAIRCLAASLANEVSPVLPAKLIRWLQSASHRYKQLDPLVADVVQKMADTPYELKIASCRATEGRRQSATIVIQCNPGV